MPDYPGTRPNRLTYAQLEGAWIRGVSQVYGGRQAPGGGGQYAAHVKLAPLMAAIAEAESSGDANAYNPTDNGGSQTSWGLWQISNGDHSSVAANWNDPVMNAELAVRKYDEQGLGAWGTYTSGAYRQYLSPGTTENLNLPGAAGNVQGASGNPSACLVQAPSVSLVVTSVGGFCILSKTEARAVLGAVMLVPAFGLAIVGVVILAAAGLKISGAAKPVGDALGAIPVPQAQVAAAAVRTAGGSGGGSRGRSRSRGRTASRRRGEDEAEDAELEARGATPIRGGRPRPRQDIPRSPAKNRPGVRTGSVPGPGRAATREEAGF